MKKSMTIFGDGEQRRAFSYIDDCLQPLWKAGTDLRASKQIINLGSSIHYTINEANRILKEITGGETMYLEQRHEIKDAYPTYDKSISLIDYKDITTFKTGLEKMWEWAIQQPKRTQKIWDKFELNNGIYSYWKH